MVGRRGEMMEEETMNENESQDDVLDSVEEEDVEVLKQSLREEKTRAEEFLANWQRTQADFINYKRRSEKEKEELGEYSRAAIVQCVLPVLDDFERAISAIPEQTVDSNWIEGVRMIEKKLRTHDEQIKTIAMIQELMSSIEDSSKEPIGYLSEAKGKKEKAKTK